MRHGRPPVCSIVPPHILRHLAAHDDGELRELAHAALEASAAMRGERAVLAAIPALLAVAAGEKRRTIYDARHGTTLPGRLVRGEGDPESKDEAINEAYDGSGRTYDFYRKVLGRNSIDDRGLRLDSSVHYSTHFNNAQWNGRQMIYGDGDGRVFDRFTKALDVIGHELTHGVTQYTAALDYRDQPGALNEHFSDVFGILVKQYTLKQSAAKSDWIVGAGLFAKGIRGAGIRSMKAPGSAYDDPLIGKDPQPSHMTHYVKTQSDNGGVHINSGIPNHAFYRFATLLGGNAWSIAGKVWYHALTRKLRHDATFQHCADATHAAAVELHGATSEPAHAVIEAWKAVGIDVRVDVVVATPSPRIPIRAKKRRGYDEVDLPSGGAEVPDVAASGV